MNDTRDRNLRHAKVVLLGIAFVVIGAIAGGTNLFTMSSGLVWGVSSNWVLERLKQKSLTSKQIEFVFGVLFMGLVLALTIIQHARSGTLDTTLVMGLVQAVGAFYVGMVLHRQVVTSSSERQ